MKKFVSFVLSIVMVMSVCSISSFAVTESVYDESEKAPENNTLASADFAKTNAKFEELFVKNNTNTVELLEQLIGKYQRKRNDDVDTNKKIDALIAKTTELIDNYTTMKESKSATQRSLTFSVELVIAAFGLLGYDLSAELLTHALDNETLDSYYSPVLESDVLCSSVFDSIRNGDVVAGSSAFPNSGGTDKKDLYFAIHNFYFRKSDSGRVVIIQDRYDYEEGSMGESLVGDVVNLMYEAQEAGILVPFYTYIVMNTENTATNQNETVNITSISQKRYYESHVVLGKNEVKDFYITFNISGKKMIQTFGAVDTMIELYDSENNQLINSSSIDDAGYKLNSMVLYDVEAGQTYRIRVKLYNNSSKSGEFKLCITPATYLVESGYSEITTYESIWAVNNYSHYTLTTTTKLNHTKVLTFTAPTSGTYTFETESDYDTFIYVLDPRSFKTFNPIDASLNEVDKYNDDSGDGGNAKVSIDLVEGVPYFVIYSAWNISNESSAGSIKLHIDKE